MSMQLKKLPFGAEEIIKFAEKRKEPKWFTDTRLKGLGLAEELPLPKPEKTRIADWNFTNFSYQIGSSVVSQLNELPESIQNLMKNGEEAANVLIHVNSSAVYSQLSKELTDQGVIYTDLATAVREHSDLLANYYFKTTSIGKHQLTAMNAALVNGGTFLYIPKNVVIEQPIQAVYYQDAPSSGLVAHTVVVAEQSSSVTFVESYLSDSSVGEGAANLVNEVIVGENAQVKYGAVDEFTDQIVTYVSRQAEVAKDGRIQWALGQMNDGNTLSENATNLEGDGAAADIKAVSIGSGTQKQNFDNYVRHVGKATQSQLLVRAAQKDASNSIFNARTKIEHGASGADGEQTQRVLMLSDDARGDANPILLIDEYDVIAGHAASVGRVDPDQLYYLMSRGIKQELAEKLIVEGFLAPIVDLLPIEGVRRQLTTLIERKVG
ncbi:Fe-S cluster assembly protein SufD [Sporolactobacillus shoreicorticis]|uniref:Fe-S cluster assembly protein SufD n=1 Tax=Sporolactobacillus shoreicorticis TaxID=1923877 RepID=A0ABW5SAB6_9BACL|nr:Fe-S cluster assembly protein SufD [Sporolactobacillus shoreicorticis]MCO7127309.1 Fe-S cluster assembly protein SufD [Sporolactobacillus shoreicorticis]